MQLVTWIVPNELAIARIPVRREDIKLLKSVGFRAIVCLATEREIAPFWGGILSYESNVISESMEFYFLPVEPGRAPDTRDLIELLNWISSRASKGRPVVVHCFAGVGRAGTVAAAYLIFAKGMMPQAAMDYVRRIRPNAIESWEQEEALIQLSSILNFIFRSKIPLETILKPIETRKLGTLGKLKMKVTSLLKH